MKILLLLPVINLLVHSSNLRFSTAFQTDTTAISHLLDGHIEEWPQSKFITNKETKTRYAVDNDNQTLFVAINIPDKIQQQKIMQQGMSMFIDTKGKKKENRGVQYPLGMENGLNMESMKVFGFSNAESMSQNIKTERTINIALAWDSSNVLSIEYNIPLKILDETSTALSNKNISIGWKIKESETPDLSKQPVATSSRLVAVPAGPRVESNRNSSTTKNSPIQTDNRPQSFWTSHTIIF